MKIHVLDLLQLKKNFCLSVSQSVCLYVPSVDTTFFEEVGESKQIL